MARCARRFALLGLCSSLALAAPAESSWKLIRRYADPRPELAYSFGHLVATPGSKVAVGAPNNMVPRQSPEGGALYVFDADSGQLQGAIADPSSAFGAFPGAVTAAGSDLLASAVGHAVYLFDGDSGDLRREFLPPTSSTQSQFGAALAATAEQVLIGDWGSGTAYLFDVATGELVQTFVQPPGSGFFAAAVALAGSRVLIGAFGERGDYFGQGAAYLLDAQNGVLIRRFAPTGVLPGAFGSAVTFTPRGDVLVADVFSWLVAPYAGAVFRFDQASGDLIGTYTNPWPTGFLSTGIGTIPLATRGEDVVAGFYHHGSGGRAGLNTAYLFSGRSGSVFGAFLDPTPDHPDGHLDPHSLAVSELGDVVIGGSLGAFQFRESLSVATPSTTSTTLTTSSPNSTPSTTVPAECGPTGVASKLTTLGCRLDALAQRMPPRGRLGRYGRLLEKRLEQARAWQQRAQDPCLASERGRARLALDRSRRVLGRLLNDLRAGKARTTLTDPLHNALVTEVSSLRADTKILRQRLSCPSDASGR
jgi:hypothetical protein